MKLIVNPTLLSRHVSVDTIDEFESAILSDKEIQKASLGRQKIFSLLYTFHRILAKIDIDFLGILKSNFIKPSKQKIDDYLTVMLNIDYFKLYPYLLFSKKKRSCYMFDAWPNTYDKIIYFANFYYIDHLFISSSQATQDLRKRLDKTNVHWVPEGINPEEYKHRPFHEKEIDILAIGRRYDLYHDKIVSYFDNSERKYVYEKIKGEVIFPSREEFIEGLAKAKISICIPSNVTHPERAGNIETMTIRYLQSIVSKCLIVGHAPEEMIALFGYNPVIEIDMENPIGQLNDILDNYDAYIPLIEKNYQAVLNNHTWAHRWLQIKNSLAKG